MNKCRLCKTPIKYGLVCSKCDHQKEARKAEVETIVVMERPKANHTSIHLNDGAYATFTGYSIFLTAGHQEPANASNIVHLDPTAIFQLLAFIREHSPEIYRAAIQ